MRIVGGTFHEVWHDLLDRLVTNGVVVRPRGLACRELTGVTLELRDARSNLFYNAARDVRYGFAVAEWLWIWFGHDDVATIGQYNSRIHRFSDDGEIFAGAYGPRIGLQWTWVEELLRRDHDTRQAVITIFAPTDLQRATRDVPCTLTLQFFVRAEPTDGTLRLCLLASMRSSDVWLGLPYDVFSFTMLQNVMAGRLGIDTGWFQMSLGSSHLYAEHADTAVVALDRLASANRPLRRSPRLPGYPPDWLDGVLHRRGSMELPQETIASSDPTWNRYALVLCTDRNNDARHWLEEEGV